MVAVEPVAAASGPLSALISATNPVTFLGSLSYRGWFGLGLVALVSYCNWISTLSRRPKDAPCPEFGRVLRVLYGLFGTRVAEFVLGYFLFTKAGEPQPEQNGGTVAMTVGRPELRVEIIPVLGQPSTLTPTPTPTIDRKTRTPIRCSARCWAATTRTSCGTRRIPSAVRSSWTHPTREPHRARILD